MSQKLKISNLSCFKQKVDMSSTMMSGIPKIIHQIWFQGEDKLPDKHRSYKKTWIKHNPNWKYILWSEKSIRQLIKSKYDKYYQIYEKLPLLIQKVDMAKYFIVYTYGGIYVDMDMKCLKSLDDITKTHGKGKQVLLSQINIGNCTDKSYFCPKIFG